MKFPHVLVCVAVSAPAVITITSVSFTGLTHRSFDMEITVRGNPRPADLSSQRVLTDFQFARLRCCCKVESDVLQALSLSEWKQEVLMDF